MKLKIKTKGIYLVNSSLWIYTGENHLSLKKNSNIISKTPNIASQNQQSTSLTWIGELNINDILEMQITNSAVFDSGDLSFSIVKV